MAKNDFDVDFDFEKEFGFDPESVLGSEYTEEDLDLSEFAEELEGEVSGEFDDFDLDSLDLGDLDLGDISLEEEVSEYPLTEEPAAVVMPEANEESPADSAEAVWQEMDFEDEEAGLNFADEDSDFGEELEDLDFADDFDENEDLTDGIDFDRRTSFFGEPEESVAPVAPMDYEEPAYEAPSYEEVPQTELEDTMEPEEEAPVEETENNNRSNRLGRLLGRKDGAEIKHDPIKLTMPPFLTKLGQLYFPTRQQIAERMEGGETKDGRRRRRPSRTQIFKEFYLPTIIAGLAVVLILSFVIGAISNSIDRMQVEREEKDRLAQQESIAAEQQAFEAQDLLARAEELAKSYNYQEAIDLLDTYTGEPTQEMTAKRAEYMNAKSMLVEHQDPTLIPNLSFHVLIHDMTRALADDDGLAGQYNRNFVSTQEFSKILTQLYANNFVLVDFDSFVSSNSVDGSSSSYFSESIWLPEGKKPVMLTETMANYFYYMVDGNDDGVADASGDGFASRLVVDSNGDIKAEYVDENGQTHVGNYDLVPILEDFIAQHPDFSYQGARATLAVSGSEGIFGYRIQSETIAKKGQDYYNEQVVGATKVVEALKAKGYRLACYSFDNKDYKSINAAMVQEDLQKWKSQISPVIGELDTIVFARASDIGDYTGGKFDVLKAAGFRFLIKNADVPYTEINNEYVRQSRLMVTGENMVAKANMFTDTGLFDPNTVLDLATRGNVPTG